MVYFYITFNIFESFLLPQKKDVTSVDIGEDRGGASVPLLERKDKSITQEVVRVFHSTMILSFATLKVPFVMCFCRENLSNILCRLYRYISHT